MTTKIGGIIIDVDARLAKLEASLAKGQRDFSRFEQNTKRTASSIEKHVSGLSMGFKAMGAAVAAVGIGQIAGLAMKSLDYAASLGEISQQVGVTVEQLQVYRYAATQVNLTQEEMEKGLQKLTVALGKAQLGSRAEGEAFKALSEVIGKDIVGSARNAGDALPLIAEAMSRIQDPTKRAAAEVAIFGRTGQKLDPLLTQGAAGMKRYEAAAKSLGIVISTELSDKADKASDRIAELNMQLEANISRVVADNADAIMGLVNALISLIAFAGKAGLAWRSFRNMQEGIAIDRELSFAYIPGVGGIGKNLSLDKDQRQKLYNARAANLEEKVKIDRERNGEEDPSAKRRRQLAEIPLLPPGWGKSGGIGNFLGGSGGGKSSKAVKEYVDPIAEMVESVDISVRNSIISANELYSDLGINEGDLLAKQIERIETVAQTEREINEQVVAEKMRIEEQQINTLARMFEDGFRGGTSAIWDNFKNIGLQIIAQLAARMAMAQFGSSAGAGGGGFEAMFASSIGSVFGFADGGKPPVGRPSIIGEAGPELWVPSQSGMVIPNHMMAAANDTGRGAPLSITINAPGATAETVSMIRREIANAAPALVRASTQSTIRTTSRRRLG